jgi:hypothetical protein
MSGVKHIAFSEVVGAWKAITISVPPAFEIPASEFVEFSYGVSPSSECSDTNRPCPEFRYRRCSVKSVTRRLARWCPSVTAGVLW